MTAVEPGRISSPEGLGDTSLAWVAAVVPGTIALSLREAGTLGELERAEDYDARDWWYRCRFEASPVASGEEAWLRFEGLATLAEVWLNGDRIVKSANMFRELAMDVTNLLRTENELSIRFASLRAELDRRRPRPQWRTNLVEHQQLRWFRTTLLGRIPGWSPPVRAVGPWRPVWLERRSVLDVVDGDVLPSVNQNGPTVDVDLTVRRMSGVELQSATLRVLGTTVTLALEETGPDRVRLRGSSPVAGAELWWPHTHGAQPRYPASLQIDTALGPVVLNLGQLAFRSIIADTSEQGFRLIVNGVPIFCRGACWTSADIVSLRGTDERLDRFLGLARDAHMNMLRVGGTMVYEDERFYEQCDKLGILVWQDFMFANMDYPVADEAFRAEATAEAREQLCRLRRYASLAVWCGGSEVEQQAAMLGLPPDRWTSALYAEMLPAACAAEGAGTAYVRNSPTGGVLPFSVNEGISHYYGVGAYLRPLGDARRAQVRFTTETLGFANVPERATLERFLGPGQAPPHHPRWKARVPRDTGPGWDFDDIRDYYFRVIFRDDPMSVRYSDVERYLLLSRITTAEVMARTFTEWRSGRSCWGGLVWFFQDLWEGAGWGLVDSTGLPKAPWYYLRRTFAPRTLLLTDEGLNGLALHIINDDATELRARLRVSLVRDEHRVIASATSEVFTVPARGVRTDSAERILGQFLDSSHAYRFGPADHGVVQAELVGADDSIIAQVVHWSQGLPALATTDAGLSGRVVHADSMGVEIELTAERATCAVTIDAGGWNTLDNYVALAPGGRVRVRMSGAPRLRPSVIECEAVEGGRCRVRLESEA